MENKSIDLNNENLKCYLQQPIVPLDDDIQLENNKLKKDNKTEQVNNICTIKYACFEQGKYYVSL